MKIALIRPPQSLPRHFIQAALLSFLENCKARGGGVLKFNTATTSNKAIFKNESNPLGIRQILPITASRTPKRVAEDTISGFAPCSWQNLPVSRLKKMARQAQREAKK